MIDGLTNDRFATVGIDLGKNAAPVIGIDERSKNPLRLKISRGQEACGGAYRTGR